MKKMTSTRRRKQESYAKSLECWIEQTVYSSTVDVVSNAAQTNVMNGGVIAFAL